MEQLMYLHLQTDEVKQKLKENTALFKIAPVEMQ